MADAQDEGYNAYPLFDVPKDLDKESLEAGLNEVVKTLQETGTVFVYGERLTVGHLRSIATALTGLGWGCNWNMKRDSRVFDGGRARTVVRIDAYKK